MAQRRVLRFGRLAWHLGPRRRWCVDEPATATITFANGAVPALDEPDGHVTQYADIFQAIENWRAPGVTVQHAIDALATVRAVYLAATLQRPVAFAEMLAGKYDDQVAFIRRNPPSPGH
ncbi:hypothetical protein OG394_07990 [Kribbella sp. NBC_01245]|nr:hypothetical protein [Kribbella sp. NBC_01245]